ncbi:type IV secretory system conjugative DNA transfer family protein [Aureliella helgolandensis]|uniref:AAA-like domain protein n=1 Tax=Aureliella helgolandensis TaxID=2527968 RepID=A0A518GBZ7_9BACT|nr:type IV secretory system conjugative DNA transfer family protein [Aureliella helgolandensis]QDV26077.1 AAA-like domain protein [Aureliella helgolandensis]
MVRSSYYKPEGNPVNVSQLPKQLMPLAFPTVNNNLVSTRVNRNLALGTALVIDLGAITLSSFATSTTVVLFIGFATLLGGTILRCWTAVASLSFRDFGLLALLLLSHAAMLTISNRFVTLVIVTTWISYTTYLVGLHWIHRCTVSPLPREQAAILIQQWHPTLILYSISPFILLLSCLLTGSTHLFFAGTLLMLAYQTVSTAFTERMTVRMLLRPFNSFLSYNIPDHHIAGAQLSAAGGYSKRLIVLLGSMSVGAAWSYGFAESNGFPIALPAVFFLAFPVLVFCPLGLEAGKLFAKRLDGNNWREFIRDLRVSIDPHVRGSLFLGRVAQDGMPVLYPMGILNEHMHILGSTGSNKSSKGLMPLIEQIIEFGFISVICLDLKGDRLELMACMMRAIREINRRLGLDKILSLFSTDSQDGSQIFNPLESPVFRSLSLDERVSLIVTATNLIYGEDYGTAHFDAKNIRQMRALLYLVPEARSFRELYDAFTGLCSNPATRTHFSRDKHDDSPHLEETLYRLASIDAMQVTQADDVSDVAKAAAINIETFLKEPSYLYMRLASAASAKTPPTIARLLLYLLIETARRTPQRIPVVVVIDEFQQLLSPSIKGLLQQARSLGIGIVMANQSIQDLRSMKTNLIPTLERNVRIRQWFDCGEDDREYIIKAVGERVEHVKQLSADSNGTRVTTAEVLLPRLSVNELNELSDNPMQSVVHIKRGQGYARFSGTPFVMESDYHITRDEYRKYQDTEWPEGEARLLKNGDLTARTPQGAGSKPVFTNEEDADDGAVLDETLSGLFGKFTEGEIRPWLESDDDQTEAARADDDHTEVDHEE